MSAVGAALAVVDAERDAREQRAVIVNKAVQHFLRVAEARQDWPAQTTAYRTLAAYSHLDPYTFQAVFEGIYRAVPDVISRRFEEATR